jgi:hypothetical protein
VYHPATHTRMPWSYFGKRLTPRPDLYELILVRTGRLPDQLEIPFHPLVGLSEYFTGMGHANFAPYLFN